MQTKSRIGSYASTLIVRKQTLGKLMFSHAIKAGAPDFRSLG
ncbi:hypothetical protein RTCIAT899_PB01550 (plasmid) [Rhizobium tropici CIAT 899]|nr:hypothetical protein RTCIAT899_PB01550 [Rhizobium tropici CIAT 899]